ncbi:hypothetical protein [Streptomyces pinistramenti]|uniref:hypothetical protein n=1 Tax=Streptomyces pinistramenti TaxID=2884812 RepID=UPI001D08812C|nr:hypothetical protein [Streptomyces pinistramenti]MCB5906657.1 hypothetical protein [Streptomyces pinistramenti]
MVATAPRVVVIAADDGLRSARAARLAAHFGVPRLTAADVLADHRQLPRDGYVLDGAPQLLDRVAGAGALLPVFAFADLVVYLRARDGSDADDIHRVIRYYEARGVLVGFRPDAPDGDIFVAIVAALRERPGEAPPRLS